MSFFVEILRSRMARWAALRRLGGVTADSEATTLDLPLFLSEAAALLLHLLLHPLHCRRTSRLEDYDYVECHLVWGFLN